MLKINTILCTFSAFLLLGLFCGEARAQSGSQGAVAVTVTDATGGLIPQAHLELVDPSTNAVRTATTQEKAGYTFVNVNIGTYRLTVTKTGYSNTVLESILVHSAQTTDVAVTLQVGKASDTVTVSASMTPLLDVSTTSIGSVIDLKWIEDLPMLGRDLTALARLTPGYTGNVTGSNGSGYGVWNGQPFSNQSSSVDGAVGGASRGKFNGNVNPAASPRIENIAEMSVVTDQLDLDQGFGQATMQVNFVTRAGTNEYHGRIYVDSRNSGLWANTYAHNVNKQRRTKVIFTDFGGSVGGPILRDKLFFFGGLSSRRIPQQKDTKNNYLTSAMQSGSFTYVGNTDTDKTTHTVNLLSLAQSYNTVNGASLPTTVNSKIASELSAINSSLSSGTTLSTTDPNINELNWTTHSPDTYYYPTVRLDYNLSSKVRMNLAWNITNRTTDNSYAPTFPGAGFSGQGGSYHMRSYTASYGVDWDVTPMMINQFKVGYLYNSTQYAKDAKPLYASNPTVYWGMDGYGFSGSMSGQVYTMPTSNFYPVLNASDTLSWQKGAHSFKMGFSWYREQDHYWNDPQGFPKYSLGLAAGDPAINAFSPATLPNASSTKRAEAQQLYAILTGRLSSVSGSNTYNQTTNSYSSPGTISAYNLDERQTAWGLFFQDSWRVSPSLTFNYGLRWDFTGDNYDLTGAYHSTAKESIYGPSGVDNLFNPGSFKGVSNPTVDARPHSYDPWNVSPQPAVGLAWNPKGKTGLFGKIVGDGETVVRAGFNLRRFTVPQQYIWDNASSYGAFFYQKFYLNANTTGESGTFTPGSLSLGSTMPAYGLSPSSYLKSEPLADFTFINSIAVSGIDQHIKQPYTESWNLGIERQFGHGALEIRYNGNRTLRQWIAINPNEVNVFENGFLEEFKKAQANLKAYMTAHPDCGQEGSAPCSFANNGLAGQSALPIMNAAFAGSTDYTNTDFVNYLQTGQVGTLASTLSGVAGTTTYFCNLVGSNFTPCATNAGYSGGGAGYPTNFFQANPYAAGTSSSLMVSKGYSSYHALQLDYRQQVWRGLSFDANYTFGKTLGLGSTRNWTAGGDSIYTLRNMRKGYGPTPFDIRHVLHLSGTYDLPIGPGKAFLGSNHWYNRVLGNWTVGSLLTFQSGAAQQITGGNYTYNDYADGGVRLNGVTRKQLQSAVGVHRVQGTSYATLIDSKYLQNKTGGGANSSYISANTTPGTIGDNVYLYGPHAFYHDVSVSKAFPIREKINFKLQGEFLNVWNHPVFGSVPGSFGGGDNVYTTSVQSSSFAVGYVTNNPRWVELRANLSF